MVGRILLLMVVIIWCVTGTLAVHLQCRYDVETNWSAIDDVYFCDLKNELDIPNPDTEITSLTGEHADHKSNVDVRGFLARHKTMHYLPHGLEKYFDAEKIDFIAIWATGLKQIHQADLAPFPKLRFFTISNNDVKVIERDLFKFNPKIEYIDLGENKIKFIDGNVFHHLKKLFSLFLKWNDCISREAVQNYIRVLYLTRTYQANCTTDIIQ